MGGLRFRRWFGTACLVVAAALWSSGTGYAAGFAKGGLSMPPARRFAVVTCMDARLDPARFLGLEEGDAHVIRNAGGIASPDAIRSLLLSQRLLATKSVMVIHHTRCGLESFEEEAVQRELEAAFGERPPFRLGAYSDVDADVRATVATLRASRFIDHTEIRGFVFDVDDGGLREVHD